MSIQIELNDSLQEVTKEQLFAFARNGRIKPGTPLHYKGTKTVVGKVKGIVFSQEQTTGIADEFDHALTVKPNRTVAKRDDIDTMKTMPPPLPSELAIDAVKNSELKRGDILDGKFYVIKKLGQGGIGAVYKVIDDADVEYAIKVVLPEYIDDATALKELRTELAKAQSFTHQNLLNYKFFANTGQIKYIVMELIDGENLEEYRLRKGGKITEADARPIIDQILNGLDYFHNKGLVHLDLKPQNIMVSKSGEVKITDYGIAKSIKEQIEANTQDGEMLAGTLCFMAPEQLNGTLCDRRTDIYALGLIVYQLLTGELPFELQSRQAIVAWHLNSKHSCPTTSSSAFDQVIAKAISSDPKQRFTNCAEIAEALTNQKITEEPLEFLHQSLAYENLHIAVARGTMNDVRYFVEEKSANVNTRDNGGLTPLHVAAGRKGACVEILQYLVSSGADVNAKNNGDVTPLHLALIMNPNMEILKYLISQGANVNARDNAGYAPLHIAAGNNPDVDILKCLVFNGADVNVRNKDDATPLHFAAAINPNAEILQCLVSHGADVNARNNFGGTPLDAATTEEKKHILREAARRI